MRGQEPLLLVHTIKKEPPARRDESSVSEPGAPSWVAVRFMAVFGAALLFEAAFLNISYCAVAYLIAAFLYLSFSLSPAVAVLLSGYTSVMLAIKLVAILTLFSTDFFSRLDKSAKDLCISAGLTFLDKQPAHCILALVSDGMALLSLLIVRSFGTSENAIQAKHPGSVQCKVWCWLAVGFILGASLAGETLIYSLVSGLLVVLLGVWATGRSMSGCVFPVAAGVVFSLVPIVAATVYLAQALPAKAIPEQFRWGFAVLGLEHITTVRGWTAFACLLGAYICTSFFDSTSPDELAAARNLRGAGEQLLNPDDDYYCPPSEEKKEDIVFPARIDAEVAVTSWELMKHWASDWWKQLIWTPFGMLLVVRVAAVVWVLKYNSVLSLPVLVWLYYSIWYGNAQQFCRLSPCLLIPAIAFQLVGSKIVCVPQLVPARWEYAKYLPILGMFPYAGEKGVNSTLEFAEQFAFLALVCAAYTLRRNLAGYSRWERDRSEVVGKLTCNLEIVVHFVVDNMEKLYMVLIYLTAFTKVDIMHTLILCFIVLFVLRQRCARRHFVLMIFIVFFRSMLVYSAALGRLFGHTYSEAASLLLTILGVNANLNESSRMFFKFSPTWEFSTMYFCTFVQFRALQYLLKHYGDDNDLRVVLPESESGCAWIFTALKENLQKSVLWAIYLVLFVVLAYQEPTVIVILNSVLLVVLISMHTNYDLSGERGDGSAKIVAMCHAINVINPLIIFVSYVFCLLAYTFEVILLAPDSQEYYVMKALGFDPAKPSEMCLQLRFLPQFAMLYLSHLAQQHVQSRQLEPPNSPPIEYSSDLWSHCLLLLDTLSKYSFHLLFLLTVALGVFWSLNGTMLLYMCAFCVHYLTLHLRFLRGLADFMPEIVSRPKDPHEYTEREATIARESSAQAAVSDEQRRRTLRIILGLTCAAMLVCQLFRLEPGAKQFADRYLIGETRVRILYLAEVVQAVGTVLGVMSGEELGADSFIVILSGYIAMMYMCALENLAISWHKDRLGYIFKQVSASHHAGEPELHLEAHEESPLVVPKDRSNAERQARYRVVSMLLLGTVLEHVILGAFFLTAALKNSVLEIAFILIAILCVCVRLSHRLSWAISCCVWLSTVLHYGMCVANMDPGVVPQQINDSVFRRVFRVDQWPPYKIVFPGQEEWAHYFALASSKSMLVSFLADAAILCAQAVYFQNFCHGFYSLDRMEPKVSQKEPRPVDEELRDEARGGLSLLYDVMRKVFFLYSHTFVLCFLLLVSTSSSGAITILYVIFCVVFIQVDLFYNVGAWAWSLPLYIRYILRPYILLDIIVQFTCQVPFFADSITEVVPYIGIQNFNKSTSTILLKIAIFTLVIYQEAIFKTPHYTEICRTAEEKTRRLEPIRRRCMSYLYNNRRVREFRRQKYVTQYNHVGLARLDARIKCWNNLLHRNAGVSQEEAGARLDLEELRQHINQMQEKLQAVADFPHLALSQSSFLERVYSWLFDKINHVAFLRGSKLLALEKRLEAGTGAIPNYVTAHHVSEYTARLRKKIATDRAKLSDLERRLGEQPSQIPEEDEPATEPNKELSTSRLVSDIFVMCGKLIYSSTEELCFVSMLLAHALNGNLLSLPYIMGALCYAMVVRCRPSKLYWQIMLMYTGVVIVLKYAAVSVERIVIASTNDPEFFSHLQYECGARLGLFDGLKYGLQHFLFFDELVLIAITFHMYVLGTLGIRRANEEDTESIRAAVGRANRLEEGLGLSQQKEENSLTEQVCPRLRNEKPGKDYHDAMIIVQVVICAYILLFFGNMSREFFTLSHVQIKVFSAMTVAALAIQIAFIMIDFYLYYARPQPSSPRDAVGGGPVQLEFYQESNRALLGKFWLHLFQVLVVNLVIFWVLPNQGNMRLRGHPECRREDIDDDRCNEPHANVYLLGFYAIYCVYFWISAKQIRAGWTEIDEREIHRNVEGLNGYMIQVFYAIPFAWELQQLIAWVWSTTSLDIYRWFKFDEIYTKLCTNNSSSRKSRIGTRVATFRKFSMGVCILVFILGLIMTPVVVFSSLNPMVATNNPTRATLAVSLEYGSGVSLELIPTTRAVISSVDESVLEGAQKFDEISGQYLEQFVRLTFPTAPDSTLFPTLAKCQSIANQTQYLAPYLKYAFTFSRSAGKPQVSLTFTVPVPPADWDSIRTLFAQDRGTIHLRYPSLFCSVLVLTLDEEPREVARCEQDPSFLVDADLQLNMTYFEAPDGGERLPKLAVQYVGKPWSALAVSEKARTAFFATYSVITLFTGLVIFIGKFLRGYVSGGSSNIMYNNMPRTGPLMKLCSGVIIARYDRDLEREATLYVELIDVLRSSEVLKMITKDLKDMYIFPPLPKGKEPVEDEKQAEMRKPQE